MITPDELEILRKPEVQEYIREKMGQTERGDLLYNKINKCVEVSSSRHEWHSMFLAIPDCISRDSKRPERGLVGMLDDSWEIIKPCLSDKWMVRCLDEQMGQGPDALSYVQNISFSGAPRLALLKALEWQIWRK